jgi:hypothetical protein
LFPVLASLEDHDLVKSVFIALAIAPDLGQTQLSLLRRRIAR